MEYLPTFTPFLWPSHVGFYIPAPSTMEHMGIINPNGLFSQESDRSEPSGHHRTVICLAPLFSAWATRKSENLKDRYNQYQPMHFWLVVDLPLWKMMEFISLDDYSQCMETTKMFETTNQIWVCLITYLFPVYHPFLAIEANMLISHRISAGASPNVQSQSRNLHLGISRPLRQQQDPTEKPQLWLGALKIVIPSGKRLHNYGKSQCLHNGKINYFYGHFQ
jgi:hypothetical protein